MKKMLIIAAGLLSCAVLGAEVDSGFSGSAAVKFENEHFNRGRLELKKTFLPTVELRHGVFESSNVYIGCESALPLRTEKFDGSSVSPYIGFSSDVTDKFMLDLGYVHYFYVGRPLGLSEIEGSPVPVCRYSDEIYIGLVSGICMSPSIYCSYDFGKDELNVETKISYSYNFSENEQGLEANFSAKAGYDRFHNPFGFKLLSAPECNPFKKDYVYYGVGVDLSYKISNSSKLSVGVSYERNAASKGNPVNVAVEEGRKSGVVFSTSIDCAF